jgi:hypothetical protein
MSELSALYEKDFSAWAMRNAELLRRGHFAKLDIEHLLEELSDMGTSQRNELESRLTVLLAHLLKWQYQYRRLSEKWREYDGRSWRYTIIEQRDRIAKRLGQSPGLKSKLGDILVEAYDDAVALATKQTGLSKATFPSKCPYSLDQILDDGYYPPME